MARVPTNHSRCWLCGTSVLFRWNRIVYFSRVFGQDVGRKVCWDCHSTIMRLLVDLKAGRL
jgi:hypothetical protein